MGKRNPNGYGCVTRLSGNRKCIDMLMGHKSKDVGNRVYNHKTVEQLRDTVELLE